MIMPGHIKNGVVVLDSPNALPEGTAVRVEVVSALSATSSNQPSQAKRTGGQYAGQIVMAPDFDEWPDDIQEAFGMKP